MYSFEIPTDYEGLNAYNSMRSVAGRVQNDYNTAFYMRALWQRAIAGTSFKLPKSWRRAKRYFKNVLFSLGFIGVIDTPDYGVIPQICTFSGYGLFLQPVKMLVSQPLVQFEGTIGENCELIHLCGDFRGIWDIVEHFAIRLSVAITSVDCALMNERISFLAAGKSKQASETLKYLYEKISAGEPFAVYDKAIKSDSIDGNDEPIWTYSQDVASQYISDKLLADIDTILMQFDKEIGIAAVGEKKERMLTDEIAMQNEDACARSSTWFENLSDSFDLVNELFPDLGLSFTMKYGGEVYEYNAKTDADRAI
jgi:hypothetical protein